jgi:hypothetical protein
MKHRIVHFLQRYLFNPPIKFLFAIGLIPPSMWGLARIGRRLAEGLELSSDGDLPWLRSR